jgi:hypothetical protein
MNIYFFNGTHKGEAYHGKVSVRDETFFNVDVLTFDKTTHEATEQYERLVSRNEYTPKQAVRAVISNPFNF